MTDRYRKKPVEVRAWKIGLDGQEPDWVREAFDGERIDWCPAGEGLYINTLEGHMKAGIGDMLIEGVKGELYGCRADIFAATYEPVETTLAERDSLAAEVERLRADVAEWKARADDLAAALHNCIKLAYNRDQDELPSAIITTASKAVAKYDMLVDFSAALDD